MIHRTDKAKKYEKLDTRFCKCFIFSWELLKCKCDIGGKDHTERAGRMGFGGQVRPEQRICQGCSISTEVRILTAQNVQSSLGVLRVL